MKAHKVLPHTADFRLLVESDSLAGLFETALEGMSNIIKKTDFSKNAREVEESIALESTDITALLIDFLSTGLTLSHRKKAVYRSIEIEHLSETSLSGTIKGFESDGFDEDIKAVTYHEAEIKKNADGRFETVIVFDV